MSVRVIVADDQRVVREGLRAMLSLLGDIDVVATAADAESALDLVAEHRPDVLLTDLRMPGIGGVEGIRRLRASGGPTHAVALTTFEDDATIRDAIEAGALGFLGKDAEPEEIGAALRAAATGRSLLDQRTLQALLSRPAAPPAPTPAAYPDDLTEREVDVLRLVAADRSNQQITRDLVVSMSTVKTHINHLFAKTACPDRAALVAYAYRHGLT